jgi:hypothetical protein
LREAGQLQPRLAVAVTRLQSVGRLHRLVVSSPANRRFCGVDKIDKRFKNE